MRHTTLSALLLGGALLAFGPGCKSGEPAAPPAPQTSPEGPVREGLEPFQPLVGETIDAAQEWLADNPTPSPGRPEVTVITVRPVRIDGEELAITEDLRSDRINVIVDKGVITALDGVY